MALCVLCAFKTFCNSWKSGLYTHTVLVVVVGPYTFESRIPKVAVELPNIIEGLVGVRFVCCLYFKSVQQMVQRIQHLASSIVPTVRWYYDEIHFSICILTLTITGLQRFCYQEIRLV